MSAKKRSYQMRRRAELEAQTRRRITESAVALHGTVGPSRTSISAIAEHAGVRRSTVYRHFPDERALFAACSAHWATANPLPDLGTWAGVADPEDRLRVGLEELYAFYGRNERMLANLVRDEETVAAVAEQFSEFRGYLEAARDTLLRGRRGGRRAAARGAVGHALAFETWRSLTVVEGLSDRQAVELMAALVAAAT